MDQASSQKPDVPRGAMSPVRETRTLAVREYEECIAELKKENFDLKLQLYLKDQSKPKNWKRDADEDDQTVTVQVVVDLQEEVGTLKNELSSKDKLLQDALAQSEIHASHVQELQKKLVESQEQIPLEWQQLKEDKEIFEKENEFLKNVLKEKDTVIQEANAQIEELSSRIEVLEAKVKRRSSALQGVVYKYHNDVEAIPKELRSIVRTAVQAAKECKEEELNSAIRKLKSSLCKLMPTSSQEFLEVHEQDENQDPSCTKNNSVTELHNSSAASQGEVSLPSQQNDSKSKFVHVNEDPLSSNGKVLSQSLESIDESLKSFGSKESDNIDYMEAVLKENDQFKCDNEEKLKTIQDLNSTNNELERRNIQLHSDLKEAISKVKLLETKFKDEYVERKNFENRLALSNQVNHDLMDHLRKLETFLEDLLQNKNLDSSFMESLGETSEVLTRLTSFLDETRRLSTVFSDQISICEKSELFDPKDVSVEGEDCSRTEERSPLEDQSSKSIDSLTTYSILQGTLKSPFVCKNCMSQSQFNEDFADKNQVQIVVNDLRNKCDKQQKEIGELNENYSSKAKEINSISKEKLELVNYIKELEEELQKLKIKKEELALKLSQYTEEKDKLQIIVDDLRNTCNNQENKIKELSSNYNNKAKEIDNFSKEKLEHVSYIRALEEELKEFKTKEKELAFKLSEYTEEKDKLQIIVDDIRNTCNNQENKIKELSSNYSNKAKEIDNFSKEKLEHVSYIKELEEELKEFKTKEKELAFKLSEYTEEKDKLQIIVDDLRNTCNNQQDKIKELSSNYSNQAKEIDSFSKEKLEHVSYIKELKEELKEFITKEKELAFKLSEYTEEKDKLQIMFDDLRNTCNNQENNIKELNDNYSNKAKEIDNFSKEKLEHVSYIKKLEEELKEFKTKEEELAFKLSEYTEEKDKLQIVLDELRNTCNNQKNKLEELNENNAVLSKKKHELLNYINKLEEELKESKAKETELALQLSEYDKEKDKLQIAIDELHNTCNNQKKELEELNENSIKEIDNFSKQKAELSSCVNKLKEELKDWKIKEKDLAPQLSENVKLKNSIKLLETEANKSDNVHKELKLKLEETKKSLQELDKKCMSYETELSISANSLEDYKHKVDKLEEQLIHKTKKIEALSEEKLELLSSINSLESDLKESKIRKKESKRSYETELSISANSLEDYKHKVDKLEEQLIHKTKKIEALSEEKLELLSSINSLESDLKESKIREKESTLLSSESSIKLNKYSSENVKLKNTIKCLESKASESDSVCNKLKQELKETRTRLESLDKKCSKYEVELSTSSKSLEDYKQKYNDVEKEKNISVTKVLELVSDKNELLRSIQHEKEKVQHILTAKNNLEEELEKNTKYINTLQSQYYELEAKSSKLLEEKEKQLLDSNSICAEFKEQIEKSNESFENLTRLHTISKEKVRKCLKVQEEAKEYLLKVRNILFKNIEHLRDVFQQCLDSEDEGFQDVDGHNYLSGKTSITDKDEKIEDLFTNIITLNTKFEKILCDALSSIKSTQETMKVNMKEIESLKRQNSQLSAQIKTQKLSESEDKTVFKKIQSEAEDLQQDLKSTQNELKATKSCVENMEAYVEHMKQSLEDREKSLEQSKATLSSSEAKLDSMQKLVEKHQDLLDLKDKTISELQSKVLIAQNQVTDALLEKRTLASQVKMSTNEQLESLKTKLAIAEQQIEILKKEKGHLKEHLLAQARKEKIPNHSSEDLDCLKKELADVQGQLQVKSSYIKELRTDMVRISNALEDKQKEVEELRYKLSDSQEQCTETKLIIDETEIKLNPLKKYKQELIQSILSQQKQFYEHRNISFGHLEKFKSHIEKLHSFCFSTSTLKSGNDPFRNTSMAGNSYAEKCKETVKILKTELELDVECFQNINVFFKRFVIPLVLQHCKQCERNVISSPNHSQCETEQIVSSSGKLTAETDIFTDDQISKNTSGEVVCSRCENSLNDRLIPATYALSHKIESMDSLLKSVKPLLKTIKRNFSSEESVKQAKCTSSLQKLSDKIVKLQEKTDEIFHISDALKSLLQADIFQIVNQKEEGSQESLFQRSLFSLPDLDIESDQCHESFAAEQAERDLSKSTIEGKCSSEKQPSFGQIASSADSQDHAIDSSDTLHAIGVLSHFELLKKEVQESLSLIKSVISRANYGLDLVANCSSPRKNLEFSTFKAIQEEGENIAVSLEEACKLFGKFWTAPYSSSEELNKLIQQNLEMQAELKSIFDSKRKQERYFDEAMTKLKHTERLKEKMDKKIARKLVKTKKVLRQAEIKLLESGSQDLLPLPQE